MILVFGIFMASHMIDGQLISLSLGDEISLPQDQSLKTMNNISLQTTPNPSENTVLRWGVHWWHISRIIGKMRLGIAQTCWIGIKLLLLTERGVICCSIMIEFSCTLWRDACGGYVFWMSGWDGFSHYASILSFRLIILDQLI